MHKLLEKYFKGEISKEELQLKFLLDFSKDVQGERPKESTLLKYIQQGNEYLKSIKPFTFNVIGVEKRVDFEIDGIPFVAFIDVVGEDSGDLVIVDNKSRELKPRSNRNKPTLKDMELDEILRQLYIYSHAVKQEYGKFPKLLCLNCFKNGVFIEEPFKESAYEEAIAWAKKNIADISEEEDFHPYIDYFSCRYICDMQDECCYWQMR